MPRKPPPRLQRDLAPVHPHAAAVDIGARMHVAAVSPGCDSEPVRTFGTFPGDLQRLADWFEQCRVATGALESTVTGRVRPPFERASAEVNCNRPIRTRDQVL